MPALAPLILFFSYRVSLDDWVARGLLERETALYRRLLPHLGRVAFITYGPGDAVVEPELGGIRVLQRPPALGPMAMSLLAPWIHRHHIRAAAVLKTNQASGAWTAVLAKWLFGKPLIVRLGYIWSFHHSRETRRRWRRTLVRLLERLAVRAADRVVVTSTTAAEYVQANHGLPASRVRIVPNLIDVERFSPDASVSREKDLVVFVGRLEPAKNLHALIDAARLVGGLRLQLVGDGSERALLQARAEAAGVPVEFTGIVSNLDMPGVLRRATMFVLPSHYEGQPKALLEAMACGLPVIGTNVPGIREVIRHGETGLLSEPDAASLARALRTLLDDEPLRERLGGNARAAIRGHHGLEAVMARELAVIEELLPSR